MNRALVTTIIPAFNAERYILEAIESALSQSYSNHEVVVVNDGSTDGTQQIVDSFGSRIRGIQQANSGPARSRNLGNSVAKGEWLAFLDADDTWHPQKLELQLDAAIQAGADIVYTDRIAFGDGGEIGP